MSSFGFERYEPDDILTCDKCRDTLYPGDDYYELDGQILCDDCFDAIARRMRRTVGDVIFCP